MTRLQGLLSLGIVAAMAVGSCERQDTVRGVARVPAANQLEPAGNGSGTIGAFGYKTHFLDHGRTGNGAMNSIGLAPRGGGPVTDAKHPGVTPYGLAPREHIGAPVSDGIERVVVDPFTGRTIVWSQAVHASDKRVRR